MADTQPPAGTLEDALSAAQHMRGFAGEWWIAGGWAIDLWLGEVNREHSDVEISIWRDDQLALRQHWAEWEWLTPIDHEFRPWDGKRLELPQHQLMARRDGREVEFFLNEREGDVWVSRRDERIRVPVGELVVMSERWGVPVLRPEIQLLYKAKWLREKDRADHARAMEKMSEGQKGWLRENIQLVHPWHEWAM